jgi:hypothetical protein
MHGAIPLPDSPSWRSAQLKRKDNFTFWFHGKVKSYIMPIPSAMKAHKEGRGRKTHRILDLIARWDVFSASCFGHFTPKEFSHELMGSRADLEVM